MWSNKLIHFLVTEPQTFSVSNTFRRHHSYKFLSTSHHHTPFPRYPSYIFSHLRFSPLSGHFGSGFLTKILGVFFIFLSKLHVHLIVTTFTSLPMHCFGTCINQKAMYFILLLLHHAYVKILQWEKVHNDKSPCEFCCKKVCVFSCSSWCFNCSNNWSRSCSSCLTTSDSAANISSLWVIVSSPLLLPESWAASCANRVRSSLFCILKAWTCSCQTHQ